MQLRRFESAGIFCNSQMRPKEIAEYCTLGESSKKMLEQAIQKLGFSARAYDRILKVSRTIADLAASVEIREEHVSEAVQYRSLDRNYWQNF